MDLHPNLTFHVMMKTVLRLEIGMTIYQVVKAIELHQHYAQQKKIEQEFGVRYSELCRLPYYDPIRCHLIDPMHCLLLGIAKHTLKIWIEVLNF